ncbi:GET complex subunit get2 [Yamadazyma tenuis]|nr:GET complex subunit get2 [Yamadazyma tenuis]
MAGGNATGRLNAILNQGNSVKSSTVTSVLDKDESPKPTNAPIPTPISKFHGDDDPDTSDIEQLLSTRVSPAPSPLAPQDPTASDIDEMFKKMFGGQSGNGSGDDPLTSMMMSMMQQSQKDEGDTTGLQDQAYEAQLLKYNMYNLKKLKYRFLVVRYLSVVVNFVYHFFASTTFRGSSHAFSRAAGMSGYYNNGFFVTFVSLEAVVLSSYLVISSRRKASENISSDNLVLKVVSMAAAVVPAVQRFQPVIVQLVKYWEVLSMLVGDLALVAVLFGLTSVL